MVRLKDICTINPKSPGFQDELTVSFVPMPKVGENGEFDPSEIKTYQEVKKGFTYFQNGDVLFAKITPCMENGKGAIAQSLENSVGFGSTEFHVLRPFPKYVTSKWLFYLLSWETFRNEAEKSMTGSAGQKRVPKSFLEEYDVDLPDISTQEKMTDALDKTCYLISLRKQQLAKLDELVKARFVEMFGDPVSNPMKWKTLLFGEAFEITSSKRILKSEWKAEGIPFLRVRDMVRLAATGKMDNEFFVSEKFYSSLSDSDGVPVSGDILVSATSTLGKCHVVAPGERFYFKDADVLRFRPLLAVDPIYFVELMRTPYIENQIIQTLGITTVSHFTIAAAKKIYMRCPNYEMQKQFSVFVQESNRQKLTIQQSLDKLEVLRKSLMQEYFG